VCSFICVAGVPGVEGDQPVPKIYSCRGIVQQVGSDRRHALIHHQSIPGFMPEMTMDFNVKDTNELKGVVPGSEITFNLVVLPTDSWVEKVYRLGQVKAPSPGSLQPPSLKARELKKGDSWPDGELLAEDGKLIHFSDFRGRTVALTFFFTRCPLPNFCPLMNRNFARARALLSSPAGAQTNYVFLSVSFDQDFDTPGQLALYARQFRAGGGPQWVFAAATPKTLDHLPRRLGLWLRHEGPGITHNLRTVVLDPQGRVIRQFDGNNWTAADLVSAMTETRQQLITKGSP
jgi:protein SCO1